VGFGSHHYIEAFGAYESVDHCAGYLIVGRGICGLLRYSSHLQGTHYPSPTSHVLTKQGALYSIKLKVEFWILNQLTAMASRKLKSSNNQFGSSISPSDTLSTIHKNSIPLSPEPASWPSHRRSHGYQFPPPMSTLTEPAVDFPFPGIEERDNSKNSSPEMET
jgi:hypothetical protein